MFPPKMRGKKGAGMAPPMGPPGGPPMPPSAPPPGGGMMPGMKKGGMVKEHEAMGNNRTPHEEHSQVSREHFVRHDDHVEKNHIKKFDSGGKGYHGPHGVTERGTTKGKLI